MAFQTIFKRYELKYLLTESQKQTILQVMKPYMTQDQHGKTTIRNIYFDTDNYRLIRRSIEGPVYKEKLRIRSYCRAEPQTPVFVELKKKYRKVVYKRRVVLSEKEAMDWILGERHCHENSQIAKEVDYFLRYYGRLIPVVFLSYEREAFYDKEKTGLRITFDDTILYRSDDLSLESEVYGLPLLPEGMSLMEIKCIGAIPMWMTDILSRERIYKTSFSKYGTAYRTKIFPQVKKEAAVYAGYCF